MFLKAVHAKILGAGVNYMLLRHTLFGARPSLTPYLSTSGTMLELQLSPGERLTLLMASISSILSRSILHKCDITIHDISL